MYYGSDYISAGCPNKMTLLSSFYPIQYHRCKFLACLWTPGIASRYCQRSLTCYDFAFWCFLVCQPERYRWNNGHLWTPLITGGGYSSGMAPPSRDDVRLWNNEYGVYETSWCSITEGICFTPSLFFWQWQWQWNILYCQVIYSSSSVNWQNK